MRGKPEEMNVVGAVCEEPVITIGVDGEKWDECGNDEESHVDGMSTEAFWILRWSGKHVWKS